VTPHFPRRNRLAVFADALKSLCDGMRLTFSYLVRPSTIVTRQYPENRATLKLPERFRARLRLTSDEHGYHRCTACRMCERTCPNASISILTRPGTLSKNELDRYIWRMDSCVFCNACVQSCPFDALTMTAEFENAVFDRRLLIFTLNKYAGPPASTLLKEPDEAKRAAAMEPRDCYGGPVPLNGADLPYLKALAVTPRPDPARQGAAPAPGGQA
jgi:NADH-quinone oxidoreductase subunit I